MTVSFPSGQLRPLRNACNGDTYRESILVMILWESGIVKMVLYRLYIIESFIYW
jgi:hypothetical protein